MIYIVAALLILAVAATIATPFWFPKAATADRVSSAPTERLEREKAAALLAIREAQLDQAMGKLSDEDYASLRGFYEQRAMSAMAQLDGVVAGSAAVAADRCSRCDTLLTDDSEFCAKCGSTRPSIPL